jgi:hypothetical protein
MSDPLDKINEAMDITSETLREGGERFEETLRNIQSERVKRQAEEAKRFERKMLVRRVVRVGLMAGAVTLIVKAVKNMKEETEED